MNSILAGLINLYIVLNQTKRQIYTKDKSETKKMFFLKKLLSLEVDMDYKSLELKPEFGAV